MTKPGSLSSGLTYWGILLSRYNTSFIPQKVVKGQALADYLATHLVSKTSKLHEDILDEIVEANITSPDEVW